MASQQLEVIRLVGAINGCITALHSPASPHQLRLVREEFAALRRSIERLIQDLFGLTREDREIISLFAASLENRKKSGS
jgi:gas vesicle protein